MIQWYVLYTSPRAEKQVEQRLKKMGVETYLPLHLSPRQWSDRVKMVEVPLFSSYIFVKTEEHSLRSLVNMQGVARIVYHNGKPAAVREKEIATIQSFLEKARAKELSFTINEEVLIACGPLKDISGKIKKIGKTHFILHLEQLGVTACVASNQVISKK